MSTLKLVEGLIKLTQKDEIRWKRLDDWSGPAVYRDRVEYKNHDITLSNRIFSCVLEINETTWMKGRKRLKGLSYAIREQQIRFAEPKERRKDREFQEVVDALEKAAEK